MEVQEGDIVLLRTDWTDRLWGNFPDFTSEDFVGHRIILGTDITIMEGMTNLGAVTGGRFSFFGPWYKVANTEGAQARFFAVLD